MHVKYWLAPQGWLPAYPRTQPAGSIDGTIDTQMLYMRNSVGSANVNGLVVATSANKVYGLNADTGACVWESYLMHGDVQTLKDAAGGCTGQVNVPPMPEGRCLAPGGVHSTPVIDEITHRLYVLYTTTFVYDGDTCTVLPGTAGYWLARLSLTDGSADRVVPVSASVARADGSRLNFVADHQYDRTGLLLQNGSVYISFGAAGWREGNEFYQYRGWVMRYSAGDLSLQGVFCTAANTTPQEKIDAGGSGIWQGGGGLAADPSDQQSNVYFLTGNGLSGLPTDWSPDFKSIHAAAGPPDSYGDSFVKLRPQGGKLVPSAYVPLDALDLILHDADLGSGGAMLMPGTKLVIGGGKTGILYLLDRASMKLQGQFEASTNEYHPWMRGQTWNQGPHLHGAPTYFDVGSYGYLYVWGEKDMLRSYRFDKSTQKFDVDSSNPPQIKLFAHGDIVAIHDTMPGGMLSVSASGTKANSGIVWATLPVGRCPQGFACPPPRGDAVPPLAAAVYAYNAETLKLLWNDEIGDLAHWVPPTIADGKVFVAAAEAKTGEPWTGKIIVYELCESGRRDCAGRAAPIHPRGATCEDCHHDFQNRLRTAADESLHIHAEASHRSILWGWQAEISNTFLPSGQARSIAFQASGEQIYEARADAKSRGALIWQPKESTAELVEIPRDANSRSPVRVRLRDSTWSASDGSTATSALVQIASTPGGSSLDWALFKIAKSTGSGALNGQSYIRRVYTRGGQTPDTSPQRLGETVRVPFDCQYWFYAPREQLR
jgi:outer membrane protein assembly factor BamB